MNVKEVIEWNRANAVFQVTAKIDGATVTRDVIAAGPDLAVQKFKSWFPGAKLGRKVTATRT